MDMSPPSEAFSCSATQESPNILWNPKVHNLVQKSPPPVPSLSQINPLNNIPACFSKIYFNIILTPTSRSS
jgi:hypothetical protein